MSIASPPPLFHTPFDAMASRCEVKLNAPTAAAAQRYADLAIAEVKRIEHAYSRYRPDSVVSRINAAAGGKSAVLCDAETVSLLDYAGSLFAMSDGLFDITSGVLRQAWNFKQAKVPSPSRLKPLLDLVGWARVERDGARIRLPQAGMELDFGGFGKEYAADRAAEMVRRRHRHELLARDVDRVRIDRRPQAPVPGQGLHRASSQARIVRAVARISSQELPGQTRQAQGDAGWFHGFRDERGRDGGDEGLGHGFIEAPDPLAPESPAPRGSAVAPENWRRRAVRAEFPSTPTGFLHDVYQSRHRPCRSPVSAHDVPRKDPDSSSMTALPPLQPAERQTSTVLGGSVRAGRRPQSAR